MKFCKKCNIERSLELFSRDKRNLDGLSVVCTDCKFGGFEVEAKECLGCKEIKEAKEFYFDRKQTDMLGLYCYDCRQIQEKSKYKKNQLGKIEKNIELVKQRKKQFAKIKVGNIIKGLRVIFKNSNFITLLDANKPYRKITYTINDFITNTK